MGSPYVPLPDLQQQQPNYLQTLGQVWAVRERRALANEHAIDAAKKQHDLGVAQRIDSALQQPPSLIDRSTGQPVQQVDPAQQLQSKVDRLRAIGAPEAHELANKLESAYTAHQTAQAALQKQHQDIQDYTIGQSATKFQAAADAPPQMAQTAWTAAVKYATDNGLDPEGHLSPIYDPDQAKYYSQLGLTAVQQITQKREAEQLRLQQQQAAETARHNAELEAQARATAAALEKQRQQEAGFRRQELGIQGGRLNLERQRFGFDQNLATSGLTGDDFLKVIPEAQRNSIRAIANGDIAMPSPRSAAGQQTRNMVMQYDPTYTDARYTGKQSFKTSKDATSIQQVGTLLEHAERGLDNSKKVGYAPMLDTKVQTKTDAAYMKDVQLGVGEIGKLVTGGIVGEKEGDKLESGLKSWNPSVREESWKELINLTGGRVRAGMQKYKTATGQELPLNEYFDQDTQDRLHRFGIVEQPAAERQHWSKQSPAGMNHRSGGFKFSDFPEQK